MQSHDFASTYVGTPFYMSPEICAAERYTYKSDIWSLGCIIYELCTREPPFNAKTHFQLVQKIKDGKISPLPAIYSAELMSVIKGCLKTNPDTRPSTADLLNLPVVRLMRKEREMVDMGKILKAKEDLLEKKAKEMERKLANIEASKAHARQEIESSVRREWEVKARLEIDRLVNEEMEQLRQRFEAEVTARVQEELQKAEMQKKAAAPMPIEPQEFHASGKSDYPQSLGGASTDFDGDFPSTTDITELSVDSPEPTQPKKGARTPFGRAQTMFVGPIGTPMDIEMASPSPIPIAALSLSPRRNAATKAPQSHVPDIFAGTDGEKYRDVDPMLSESDDDDEEPPVPSPSRNVRSNKNPFGPKRPVLTATKTAPMSRLRSAPSMNFKDPVPSLPPKTSVPELQSQTKPSNGVLRDRVSSPNRRLSKIPSAANLSSQPLGENGFQRKLVTKDQDASLKIAAKNNVKGRTLVELQQARAGGRPVEVTPKRTFKDRLAERGAPNSNLSNANNVNHSNHSSNSSSNSSANSSFLDPPAVWDPEKDEMPSPFLVRKKPMMARA